MANRQLAIRTVRAGAILLSLASCLALPAAGAEEFVLLSLRAAEAQLRARPADVELGQAPRLGEMIGLILDRDSEDVILLGRPPDERFSFSLEAIAQLLKCAQGGGLSGPGVSLEPRDGDIGSDSLDVVFLGGAEHTSLGLISYIADYSMKKMALNLVPCAVSSLESYAQRTERHFAERGIVAWRVLSRFWFTPTYVPGVKNDAEDIILLREPKVGVLVQTLSAELEGKPAPASFRDEAAEQYATQFTSLYDRIAAEHKEFANLARVMQGLKLMTLLIDHADASALHFWTNEWNTTQVEIPKAVPLLRTHSVKGQQELTLVGGVRIACLTPRLQRGEVDALREALLLARPSRESLTWRLILDSDWRVSIPEASEEDRELTRLFSDGLIHHERGDHSAAVQAFSRLVDRYPELIAAQYLKALCERDLAVASGRADDAVAPLMRLRRLAAEHPQFVEVRYAEGETLRILGRHAEAIRALREVLTTRSDCAPAHYALGLALRSMGERAEAAEHLREYLRLGPTGQQAQVKKIKGILEELASAPESQLRDPNLKIFRDAENGFHSPYPERWDVLQAEDARRLLPSLGAAEHIVVAFLDPANHDTNVNVQVRPIAMERLTEGDVQDAIPGLDEAYRTKFPGCEKISAGMIIVGGTTGVRYELRSPRAGVLVRQCVVTLVHRRRAYTITMTAQDRDFETVWASSFASILAGFGIEEGR